MTTTYRRSAQLGLAVVAVLAMLLVAAPARAAEPGTSGTPAEVAADWLATELEAKGGMLTVSFGGPEEFPDQGLTIDAILALVAAGAGGDPAVDVANAALAANLTDYVTGFDAPDGRAANAIAKTLLLEEISGTDVSSAYDLEAALRSLMETGGDPDPGRFSDISSFGSNFANGIGQALAILALDRTGGGVPTAAVDYLLDQQCSDGSFRLYQFGYVLSFGPPPVTVETHSCEDPAEGDADATAFALQALLVAPSSSAVTEALGGAADFLLDQQETSGGFFGTGAVNSNTTGLAAAALRAAGETAAADAGAAFLAGLQSDECAELGAIAYNQATFEAGIDADRGQWTRASAQGALGLGLPAYGGIGTVAPVDAGLDDVTCPAVPAPPVVPSVHASVGSVVAGGSVTLTAVGFLPGETVDVTLHSAPISLGSAKADAEGGLVTTVTIPADVEPGVHSIELVGETSGVEVAVEVEVLPAEGAAAGGLPATGSASGELTVAAALLIALGAALVVRRVADASRSGWADGRSDPARGARSAGWARRAGSTGRVGRCRPGRGSLRGLGGVHRRNRHHCRGRCVGVR